MKNILIQSNHILECFGNAKTNRNDNSSRFGKYMDISFDFKGDPIGGKLINYLLEKSRVVYQQNGERNFHSFYYLVFGANEPELNEFSLKPSMMDKYNYLNQSTASMSANHDDKSNYRLVNEAMRISNFEPGLIKTIWGLVAAVIHLGNLKFEAVEDTDHNNNNKSSERSGGHARVCQESMDTVKVISKLLNIDENELVKALTSRLIASGSKELVTTFHSAKEAAYARDALAKVVFVGMFKNLLES